MNVKAGDEMFLVEEIYIGFSRTSSLRKVIITRTTKTLLFVGNLKFRKSSIGIDLLEINDETIRKAKEYEDISKYRKLQSKFYNYKWEKIDLKTLMDITEILLLAENHNEEQ